MHHRNVKDSSMYFLRLDRGEDVIEMITSFCRQVGIGSGLIYGLGAIEQPEIGYYDLSRKRYLRKKLDGIFELLSLTGNITSVENGAVFLHAHVTLAPADYRVVGGHLFGGKIGVTGEFFIFKTDLKLVRKFDEKVGLKLIHIE